jgi:hypothetical protein
MKRFSNPRLFFEKLKHPEDCGTSLDENVGICASAGIFKVREYFFAKYVRLNASSDESKVSIFLKFKIKEI